MDDQFDIARAATLRQERGQPVLRSDLTAMAVVAARVAAALALPARIACEACCGASQYEGWVMESESSDPRHRGDCPAGCDFGYVTLVPANGR